MKIPEFFRSEIGNTLLISIAVVILFFLAIFIFVKPSFPSAEFATSQTPLVPVSQLLISSGEHYSYTFKSANETSNFSFQVISDKGNCMQIKAIYFLETPARVDACLNKSNGVALNALLTYENNTAPAGNWSAEFAQPWMLAVTENWSWQVNSSLLVPNWGVEQKEVTTFKFVGEEVIKGREAYKVHLLVQFLDSSIESGRIESDYWIDKETRVLLLVKSDMSSMELTSAPFNLTSGN
ncbi:MAG: hypothetical protein ABIH99_00285 [Candidatus Micrarchaeota archaeon]